MRLFDHLLLICCVVLAWVAFQISVYQKCAASVVEENEKIWKGDTEHESLADLDSISSDLAMTLNDWDRWLSLYGNFEKTYITSRFAESGLFSSEIMVPKCSSSVVMRFVPFYNLWRSAAEQARSLRQEIDSVRFLKEGSVVYEKDWDTLVDIYGKTLYKFYSLKYSVEQLSATEATFQNTLRTFPYNLLRFIFPRSMSHNLAAVAEAIALCDSELNKHPIYIMQMLDGDAVGSQHQPGQLQLAQQQETVAVAMHAQ